METEFPRRRVRAVVSVQGTGVLLGAVPTFAVEPPWWVEVEPVTRHLDALLGVPTVVLRMVRVVGGQSPRGGEVTYHVEASEPPAAGAVAWEPVAPAEWAAITRAEPLRAPYAEPGGPAAVVAWADRALAALGRPRTGPAVQIKTWNLSCVFRLPTAAGPVWSKSTRDFEAAEPVAIGLAAEVDRDLAPKVLAALPADRLMLLDDIPGVDCWGADDARIRVAIEQLVAMQAALAGTFDARPAGSLDGLLDRRLAGLPSGVERALAGPAATDLAPAERDAVRRIIAELPSFTAAIAETGLPDTLVHGDFHPGNWRSDGRSHVFLDWSDSHLGNPASDILNLRGYLPAGRWRAGVAVWSAAWREHRPESDPERAVALLAPLLNLQAAAHYQGFLDGIEPDEWPFHRADPTEQLRLAIAAFNDSPAEPLTA